MLLPGYYGIGSKNTVPPILGASIIIFIECDTTIFFSDVPSSGRSLIELR